MELRIRIEPKDQGLRLVTDTDRGETDRSVPLPFDAWQASIIARTLDVSANPLVQRQFTAEEAAVLWGEWKILCAEPPASQSVTLGGDALHRNVLRDLVRTRLYGALVEPLKDVFRVALDRLPGHGPGSVLAVRLEMRAGDVDLFQYPWELLSGDTRIGGQTQVTRYIRFEGRVPTLEPAPRVRLLVVHSEPEGLPALRLQDCTRVQEGLRGTPFGGAFAVEQIKSADPDALGDALTRGGEPSTILHFAGHGEFGRRCEGGGCGHLTSEVRPSACPACGRPFPENTQPRGYLAFRRAQGGTIHWVDSTALSDLLGLARVQLVVLSACKSALGRRGEDVFNGFAQRLIAGAPGVPAVVATPYPLDTLGAEEFARCFYQELGNGRSLVEAMDRVRRRMRANWPDDWYRPVLYLRSRQGDGGRLLAEQEPAGGTLLGSSEAPAAPGGRLDAQRGALERALERLTRQYENAIMQSVDAIDAVSQEKAEQQAEDIKRRMEHFEEKLRQLELAQPTSPLDPGRDRNRVLSQLEASMHAIDFRAVERAIRHLLAEESASGRAGLLLFQRCAEMNGRRCAERVREILRRETGSGKFWQIPVEFRPADRNDRSALLRHLAAYLGLDIAGRAENEQIGLVSKTLCGSLQHGSILLIEAARCDYLAKDHPDTFQWLVSGFWRRLLADLAAAAQTLHGGVTVIALLFVDGTLPPDTLGPEHCCSPQAFQRERLLEIVLSNWTRDDVLQWIARFAAPDGYPSEDLCLLVETVVEVTRGAPGMIENQLLERCASL